MITMLFGASACVSPAGDAPAATAESGGLQPCRPSSCRCQSTGFFAIVICSMRHNSDVKFVDLPHLRSLPHPPSAGSRHLRARRRSPTHQSGPPSPGSTWDTSTALVQVLLARIRRAAAPCTRRCNSRTWRDCRDHMDIDHRGDMDAACPLGRRT